KSADRKTRCQIFPTAQHIVIAHRAPFGLSPVPHRVREAAIMMPVILRMTLENRKPTFCVRFGRRIAKSCMAGGGQLWTHARKRERPRRARPSCRSQRRLVVSD